jgi:hypothetical protein
VGQQKAPDFLLDQLWFRERRIIPGPRWRVLSSSKTSSAGTAAAGSAQHRRARHQCHTGTGPSPAPWPRPNGRPSWTRCTHAAPGAKDTKSNDQLLPKLRHTEVTGVSRGGLERVVT